MDMRFGTGLGIQTVYVFKIRGRNTNKLTRYSINSLWFRHSTAHKIKEAQLPDGGTITMK
jgi:hypothetical protein